MGINDQFTYILKYTSRTQTAIASSKTQMSTRFALDVTTVEDTSVEKRAEGWRVESEEDGDLFVVEVSSGNGNERFELPFWHAEYFAGNAQKERKKS